MVGCQRTDAFPYGNNVYPFAVTRGIFVPVLAYVARWLGNGPTKACKIDNVMGAFDPTGISGPPFLISHRTSAAA